MWPINVEALPPLALRLRSANPGYALVRDLRLAANHRIREAAALFATLHYHGAVYLAGYAAEIGLGYCWARFTKADPKASAQGLLAPARRIAGQLVERGDLNIILPDDYRQGHSPLFWWRLYACERLLRGRRIDQNTEKRMGASVNFLQSAWDVWLRYLPATAGPPDAEEVVYRSRQVIQETYRLGN